jgi:hypothetical protein
MKILLLIILLSSCKTIEVRPGIEKPTDYTQLIEETKKELDSKMSYYPEDYRTKKLLVSLDDCNTKSIILYKEYEKSLMQLKQFEFTLIAKDKKIDSLKSELETWVTIKTWFYSIIALIVIGFILSIVWKFRKIIYPAFPF